MRCLLLNSSSGLKTVHACVALALVPSSSMPDSETRNEWGRKENVGWVVGVGGWADVYNTLSKSMSVRNISPLCLPVWSSVALPCCPYVYIYGHQLCPSRPSSHIRSTATAIWRVQALNNIQYCLFPVLTDQRSRSGISSLWSVLCVFHLIVAESFLPWNLNLLTTHVWALV